ncbi:MAG: CoA transferase [Streptosporangiaceae bacterium]
MPDPASSPVLPVPRPEGERAADWAADWADSGVTALTGRADGPALVPPGRGASVARELASLLPVDVDGPALLGERAAFTGGTRRGAVSVGGACRLLPTADGWAAVSCARPDDPALLGALTGAQIDGDPWAAVSAWLRAHPGAELAERAALLGLAAAPVHALPDVRSKNPGQAAACVEPAPVRPADVRPGPARSAGGLRVVDFSALWAGPLCAHLLGLAGADVIKVETPDRPDGARRGHPGFYRLLHAGHRSVVLDPATPRGRDALTALVASAGIVIEASRPRALARWGLDPTKTPATWISITAAGRASDRVGFGDDVAAGAGLVAWDGDGPVFAGDAIADPLSGLTAAVRALTDPPGSLIGISMTGVVAGTLDSPRDGTATTAGGTVAGQVRPPRARTSAGEAPPSGADTDSVLGELC